MQVNNRKVKTGFANGVKLSLTTPSIAGCSSSATIATSMDMTALTVSTPIKIVIPIARSLATTQSTTVPVRHNWPQVRPPAMENAAVIADARNACNATKSIANTSNFSKLLMHTKREK